MTTCATLTDLDRRVVSNKAFADGLTTDLSSRQVGVCALQLYIFIPVAQLAVHAGIATLILLVLLHSTFGLVLIPSICP